MSEEQKACLARFLPIKELGLVETISTEVEA